MLADRVSEEESTQKYFYAHKYVLAISSPVFFAMFYGSSPEKKPVINLPNTDEESVEEFLRFLYTDECTLTPEIVPGVMYLAEEYMVPFLTEKCVSILRNGLNPGNVFPILDQATKFGEKELEIECWEMVCSQTHKAVTSDNFINVSKQTLDNLLKQDTLDMEEVELFNAVLKWSDHECTRKGLEATGENKRAILGESVYQIRFSSMTQEEFMQNVSSSGVLTSEEVVSIYDKFNGKEGPLFKWKLPKRMRYLHRCSRFKQCWKLPGAIVTLLAGGENQHGFDFSGSEPVKLHGFRLFGCEDGLKIKKICFNS